MLSVHIGLSSKVSENTWGNAAIVFVIMSVYVVTAATTAGKDSGITCSFFKSTHEIKAEWLMFLATNTVDTAENFSLHLSLIHISEPTRPY